VSERRRRNRIKKLVTDDGEVVEDDEGIKVLVTNFYKSLFLSSAGSRYDELLQHVPPRVTEAMNAYLLAEYTEEEVKFALDGMGDLKAPGPDGMPTLFYKRYWSTVGQDVVREVTAVLKGHPMGANWNDTVVVLIPKVQNPEKTEGPTPH
jgi:hypothetical protein